MYSPCSIPAYHRPLPLSCVIRNRNGYFASGWRLWLSSILRSRVATKVQYSCYFCYIVLIWDSVVLIWLCGTLIKVGVSLQYYEHHILTHKLWLYFQMHGWRNHWANITQETFLEKISNVWNFQATDANALQSEMWPLVIKRGRGRGDNKDTRYYTRWRDMTVCWHLHTVHVGHLHL